MEHGNINYSEIINSNSTYIVRSPTWLPCTLIRWKKDENGKVLQQLWQSVTGEQEWRDVPEE